MKVYLIAISLFWGATISGQTTLRVFFAGNEMTQSFNIPSLIEQVADSKGDSLYWQSNTEIGYTLADHVTSTQTLGYIEMEQWDVVVFQEHGQLPALSNEVFNDDVAPNALDLCQFARNAIPCVKPAFFLPWGQKNGDLDNCGTYDWLCSYSGMQDSLTSRTIQLGLSNDAWVIPVGEAWRNALDFGDGSINLYGEQLYISTIHGSYLAACTFYRAMYGSLSYGAWHPDEITDTEAEFLQNIADGTVGIDEELWNLEPVVWADLLFNQGDIFTTITLDASQVVDSVIVDNGQYEQTWEVGDLGAQTLTPGWHYFVLDIYSACGDQLDVIDSVFIEGEIAVFELAERMLHVYPNPSVEAFNISFPQEGQWLVCVIDRKGKLIWKEMRNGTVATVQSGSWAPGIYTVVVTNGAQKMSTRLEKAD